MKYLYLKLGKKNSHLNYMLSKENLFGKPFATIYFGKITTEKCNDLFKLSEDKIKSMRKEDKSVPTHKKLEQIKEFIDAGKNKDVKFVSILKNKVFILEPDSEVFDMEENKITDFYAGLEKNRVKKEFIDGIKDSLPKIMYVKNLPSSPFEVAIPHILRTLNTVQYFNRGTCREIKEDNYWGTIQAIKKILKEKREEEKIDPKHLFELLSPHQFETLIFLILTNAGIFCPAWRAGSLPDIDIVGINYSDLDVITIGDNPPIEFKKNEEIKFQVKRKEVNKVYKNADYTVALSSSAKSDDNRILTSDWLLNVVMNQRNTKKWLENSLRWFVEDMGNNSIFDLVEK